ncbi:MAG: HAMP domain-containing sensor histidine kinase [Acidobacteriota bacterium]
MSRIVEPPALVGDSAIRAELDALALQRIPTVLRWLAGIYGAYAVAHWLILEAPQRQWLTSLALGTALAYLGGLTIWSRWRLGRRWAHPLGALIALGVLVNCVVHMVCFPEPRHTINFYLFLLGSGLLILSTPWFVALLASSWISWGCLVIAGPPSPDWLHFGIGFATFSVVITLVHRVHRRQLGRLRLLDRKNRQTQSLLEQTLAETRAASEAKSRFLAHMSHELRTPLGSIIGFADLLGRQRKGPLNPAQGQFVERIGDNGRHLLTLIDQVLDLARLESGRIDLRIEAVELTTLLRDLAAGLEPQAARRALDLRLRVPDTPVEVEADPDRLRQVVLNLAGNALKFTNEGHVEMHLDRRDDGSTVLHVRDTGIGIAAKDLERIFEPFEQVDDGSDRLFGGTGLGLAISRDLCRQMGFELSAASTPGVGSELTIRFPDQRTADGGRP